MIRIDEASLPKIDRVVVDDDIIAKFHSEDRFNELSVQLTIEAAQYVALAASTTGEKPHWDQCHAVVGGNMVRLYKLLHSLIDQTCQNRGETAFIISRLVVETMVSIRYLIANFSPDLVRSYVSHSLRHEKKLFDTIQQNILERDGQLLPIEERMLSSIERAVKIAGIPLEEVDLKGNSNWGGKNVYQKADSLGWGRAYIAVYGGPSHGVHGSWHEIYANHLNLDEDTGFFTPDLQWSPPRPQMLHAISLFVIDTLHDYFAFMAASVYENILLGHLNDLSERVERVSDAHEAYLEGKH